MSSTTPARTRSTIASGRSCWPSAWARPALSRRPARGSTALQPRPFALALACLASSIWAQRTSKRQSPNVFRMKLLGAEVVPVTSGGATLKDAMNEGLRDWVANVHDTFYIIGTAAGPHPYPELVRNFQSVIGTGSARANAGPRWTPARPADRLHRRRVKRAGTVPPLPRRSRGENARRRSGWAWP